MEQSAQTRGLLRNHSPGALSVARVKTFVSSAQAQQKHEMGNCGVTVFPRFARARFLEGTRGLLQNAI
jgi:hypothetical protein